ncbi:Dos2-interacting transcription regulator of RNA-Pol-II-domain-containing protein [Cokeromyces recurvatus]|uniref:Dos2-interacting transcription regulator of RNA-Pol-II-domain-containing protein n=1 Tax=Cokeromyces recurvatus TaxID=90255 RepID=UPI0022201142|nr:Dos2-interacting transcription regulator of RNA-Pol-II-domain-containing protein [Cokeromyces recurvatus]KAI7904266.1 Dos2-interacting transcription regulator of RNA-Pol-II-domain-containing protein [Cokeromyces recurvatus]
MEKYVTEYMITTKNEEEIDNKVSKQIIELINNKDVKSNILHLIQILGEYLVHENDDIRSKVISLLSYVMKHCEQSQLNASSVSVIVDFYCSRLLDTTSVPNLMIGLNALTHRFDAFNLECTKAIVKSFKHNVFVQSFPHITRNTAFQVFQNLLDYHLDDLKKGLEDDYISGFIQAMTGEKDPRNLMTIYTIVQKMIKLLDISQHVENLFEVSFCYFPITFRPPPDNSYGITAKDLKLNLRKCMASTPLFSKYALPLLLQKLSTTSGSAKKDTLETLSVCTTVYPPEDLIAMSTRLYDTIKMEIINGDPDPGLREPSLNAITALTKAILAYDDKEAVVIKVLKPLVDDCISLLKELDEDHVKPASLVLRAVASATSFAYDLVESAVLPLLLRQYKENNEMLEHYLILCTIVAIIQARKTVYGTLNDNNTITINDNKSVLFIYKGRIIEMFSTAINASKEYSDICLMGILGLGLLCVLKQYLTNEERVKCVKTLSHLFGKEEEEKLRMSVELLLTEIATFDPSLIIQITLPNLIHLLPDFSSSSSSSSSSNKDTISYQLTLASLEKLCISPIIYESMEQNLLKKFLYICSHNEDKQYALQVISTLLKMIQKQVKNESESNKIKKCMETLVPKLMTAVISTVFINNEDKQQHDMIILNHDILQSINLVILTIFSSLSSEEQQEYMSQFFNYFKEKGFQDFGLKVPADFCPFSACDSESQAACTQIFATIVCACRRDVLPPQLINNEATLHNDPYISFVDQIIKEALISSSQVQIISFSRMIASMINKRKDDDILEKYLEELKERLEGLVRTQPHSALTLYVWVAKALILRDHRLSVEMTKSIITWISDPVMSKYASTSFDVLIGDDALCLNKQCAATISLSYKQKFMTYSFSRLLEKYNSVAIEDEKMNYLVAIAYLFKNTPRSVFIDQLSLVIPLLIESLSIPEDTKLKLSTLDLFQFALNKATDKMGTYLISLLPALTSLIYPERSSIKVRISALQCIKCIAEKMPRDIVLPYVKDTLKVIAAALDDKKRLVRLQAVECRESWYLLS